MYFSEADATVTTERWNVYISNWNHILSSENEPAFGLNVTETVLFRCVSATL